MKKSLLLILIILFLSIISFLFIPKVRRTSKEIKDFASCLASGNRVESTNPRKCFSGGKTFIELITTPKVETIRIISPKANEIVSSPVKIEGEALGNWFFEGSFPVKMLDSKGGEIGSGVVQAKSDWMAEKMVPFEAKINFKSEGDQGKIVFVSDNPSGISGLEMKYQVPVKFQAGETTKVKIYFGKKGVLDCDRVFPFERNVSKTQTIGKAALEELIKGPTKIEQQLGYFSSINIDSKIKSLIIDKEGIARVDFSGNIEESVGGSCRVSAIRSQITKTLLQFSSVKKVVISVDGEVEQALQP